MKLLHASKNAYIFHLGQRERHLLLETIKLYPLVPASRHRLSKDDHGAKAAENQRWLEEALAEKRKENRRQVLTMLNEPQRFRETKSGFELELTLPQIEWLLQVLNDVRVGSWLALGEPEQGQEPRVTEQNANYHFALQVSGMFQSVLLAALGLSESPTWAGE